MSWNSLCEKTVIYEVKKKMYFFVHGISATLREFHPMKIDKFKRNQVSKLFRSSNSNNGKILKE